MILCGLLILTLTFLIISIFIGVAVVHFVTGKTIDVAFYDIVLMMLSIDDQIKPQTTAMRIFMSCYVVFINLLYFFAVSVVVGYGLGPVLQSHLSKKKKSKKYL
jgi:hypothetical protein